MGGLRRLGLGDGLSGSASGSPGSGLGSLRRLGLGGGPGGGASGGHGGGASGSPGGGSFCLLVARTCRVEALLIIQTVFGHLRTRGIAVAQVVRVRIVREVHVTH